MTQEAKHIENVAQYNAVADYLIRQMLRIASGQGTVTQCQKIAREAIKTAQAMPNDYGYLYGQAAGE